MKLTLRLKEYKVLFYRIALVYVFYFIARLLFCIFNLDLLDVNSITTFFKLSYHGLAFDTTAILYINSLFILLSIFPLIINTRLRFQKVLFYIYFITNFIAAALNFADIIYYRFSNFRLTTSVLNEFKGESNGSDLFFSLISQYWHVIILYVVFAWLWVYLYKKVTIKSFKYEKLIPYFGFSIIAVLIFTTLIIGGIRGDFKHSTRPINLVDANRHVKSQVNASLVLNTPFTLIRTINKNDFKLRNDFSEKEINELVKPIKQYHNIIDNKPNIVLFIIESYGREYLGAFNKRYNIPNYKSYTPFLDSLAQHSLIFDNAYANGRKSIHGMSSILSGIPSFKVAFTSSAYSNQKIQSLISCLNEEGYDTSFFHGAANGSMGFLGYGNILGLDHYYGKTEFNNDSLSDGVWGIWDDPFLQFTKEIIDTKKSPFFASVFTLTSHTPYILPEEHKGKFPVGDKKIHKVVGYTDFAIKNFFEKAKKEPWFDNTLFVFTADHTNQKYYKKYQKGINRCAVPILFYKPDNSLTKVDTSFAQQIDIYPTILDMIGYNKPFRSWGRSLVDKDSEPFVLTHTGNVFYFIKDNYICVFDGLKSIGFYHILDDMLMDNLILQKNEEMLLVEKSCRAYIQDYTDRIVNKKLSLLKIKN